MPDQILLNNEEYHLSEDNLPCLINYTAKAGGSHFSVTMVADLFLRGSKILFLTAYPMAKDNFLKQIKGSESKTAYITQTDQFNDNFQAIILESGNEKLFFESLRSLKDINERVIFIKNMEVFSESIFKACLNLPKLILSGDIDKCSAKKLISQKEFKTTVIFSQPKLKLAYESPSLEKYTGYLWSSNKEGFVKVIMNI